MKPVKKEYFLSNYKSYDPGLPFVGKFGMASPNYRLPISMYQGEAIASVILLSFMRLLRFGTITDNLQDSGQTLAITINTLDYTGGACPVSDEISTRVLCPPLYHSLNKEGQERIVRLLWRMQNT